MKRHSFGRRGWRSQLSRMNCAEVLDARACSNRAERDQRADPAQLRRGRVLWGTSSARGGDCRDPARSSMRARCIGLKKRFDDPGDLSEMRRSAADKVVSPGATCARPAASSRRFRRGTEWRRRYRPEVVLWSLGADGCWRDRVVAHRPGRSCVFCPTTVRSGPATRLRPRQPSPTRRLRDSPSGATGNFFERLHGVPVLGIVARASLRCELSGGSPCDADSCPAPSSLPTTRRTGSREAMPPGRSADHAHRRRGICNVVMDRSPQSLASAPRCSSTQVCTARRTKTEPGRTSFNDISEPYPELPSATPSSRMICNTDRPQNAPHPNDA